MTTPIDPTPFAPFDWQLALRPGDRVNVRDDVGGIAEWTVRAPVSKLGGHTWVVWLEGMAGCYALERVVGVVERVDETTDGKLADYARRVNLMDEDVVYIRGLIREAVAVERERAAKIAAHYTPTDDEFVRVGVGNDAVVAAGVNWELMRARIAAHIRGGAA